MSVASDPEIARAYAGVLAASNALVARHTRPRDISPTEIPAGYTPSGLRDMPSLLDPYGPTGDRGSAALRLARLTAASLTYTLEAPTTREKDAHAERIKPGGFTEKLLTKQELARCRGWSEDKATEKEQVCHYCRLLSALFHADGSPLEVEPINHNARIETDFDASTNISKAGIKDYLLFVPTELAPTILRRSHPLQWTESAPDLFDQVVGAKRTGEKPFVKWDKHPVSEALWEEEFDLSPDGEKLRYIYEVATFPWNPQVTSKIENVIKMIDFEEKKASKESLYSLRFDYSLESCIRSNYGITWEEHGGLNVDDGMFEGVALRLDQIEDKHLGDLTHDNVGHWIGSLHRRIAVSDDQHRWYIPTNDRAKAAVINDKLKDYRAGMLSGTLPWEKLRVEAVREMGHALEALWDRSVCLLRVSASKRLRYTVPSNGPVDIWALLTYLAPGLLFVFINRAVCQIPHFLLLSGELKRKETRSPRMDPVQQKELGLLPVFEKDAAGE